MALLRKHGDKIQWTERDRLLLIKVVIQVEEESGEIGHKSSMQMQPGEKMAKWDRVHSLLPQKLQGRSKANRLTLCDYRCNRQFFNLVRMYNAQMKGRKSGRILTKPILEMLKRREDLRNATFSTTNHSTNTRASNSRFSSDHANERSQRDFNNSRERQNGVASRSVSMTEYRDGHKSPARSTEPRLVSESKDREDLGEPSARPGVRTRAQASRRPPSPDAESNSTRKSYSTKTAQTSFEERLQGVSNEPLRRLDEEFCHLSSWVKSALIPSFEERLQGVSNEPLRRLDEEFCHLSSWVKSALIPSAKNDFNQMTISALRSSKRLKLSTCPTTKPLENLFKESLSGTIDLYIQATFRNFRVRLAQLLKHTSMEIAQIIKEDSLKL